MAIVPQTPVFSSFRTINSDLYPTKLRLKKLKFKALKISASLESSSPNSEEEPPESEKFDRIKLAFAKAKAYKKEIQTKPIPKTVRNPVPESAETQEQIDGSKDEANVSEKQELPSAVKLAFQRANEYKNTETVGSRSGLPGIQKKPEEETPESEKVDPVKLAFAKAKAYKKEVQTNPIPKIVQNPVPESAETEKQGGGSEEEGNVSEEQELPSAAKLALERAKEYRKNKEVMGSGTGLQGSEKIPGLNDKGPGNSLPKMKESKKEEFTVSSIDFMGLNFSDKKDGKRLPAGLVPLSDPFPEDDLPEVEIIVGDTSKFGDAASTKPKPVLEEEMDVYKPKVSTWGVFPRPSNISKTFGGGRTLNPGEALETPEEKAAKEARSRQLLAAYKAKKGLVIDPKLKLECQKALNDGDSLMELGKLREAIPFYEKVMDQLSFQTELYGLAALQWSICQDSLQRRNEARNMYEKLQSHPNFQVSKKAKQFAFSFQAMEMMKVRGSTKSPKATGYQNYFDAFVEDKADYPLKEAEVDEGTLSQVLPYIIFLVSPVFIVLLIAALKASSWSNC
ncbi:PREDICTED: uncharacterized protein LOC109155969 isoform X2 [Ipomoea nil]|uniref:uncharacterized protein LOC109155969 isoform X2 n=1 Tax=Ipomoea nil TaxID=35883 RepID=UPI000900B5E9|nr:PREDICTED: uncharacterized protein LOC109155969 isoform X2 [Ipomoea nil]